jgi:hypothetical protein
MYFLKVIVSKTCWWDLCIKSLFIRNDDWSGGESKNGPNEKEQSYDGPPGMDPDGIIESNWEEVSCMFH